MPHVDELKTEVTGDGPMNGAGAEHSKVVFSTEQQARVQDLIDEAYRKAYTKAQRTRSVSEETEVLRGEVESLKNDKKMGALYRAISRHNVVDAEEVAKLLSDSVKLDQDGSVVVVNGSGSARTDKSGTPVSIDEYLEHWFASRPHHLRTSGGGGAGSHGARFGWNGTFNFNLSDPGAWRNMPREDLDRLLREGVNVYGSAGQVYRFRDVKNPFLEARKRRFTSGSGPARQG